MTSRNARVWSGTEWESISSLIYVPNAITSFQSSPPSSPVSGQMWTDSDSVSSYVYSGSDWIALSGSEVNFLTYEYTASAAQTTFSGLDDNSLTLAYTPNFLQVFLNGVLLVNSTDYTATDGTSIVLVSEASAGDILSAVSYAVFSIANVYTQAQVDANTYTRSQVDNVTILKAPIISPTFTGVPAAPTAAANTSTTQLATTDFVTTADNLKADVTSETITDYTVSANVLTVNTVTGNVAYVPTAPSANFTLNITNAPTTDGKAITVVLFVVQGATGYIPSVLQIAAVGQTIKWQGGTAPTPTSTAGKIDAFSFTLIRRSAAWTVLGSALLAF